MTVLLWIVGILAILAGLILLLCLTTVRIHARLEGSNQVVEVRVWFLRFRIYPAKRKAKKEKKQAQKAAKKSEGGNTNSKKKLPKFKLKDIRDAVKTLWPPLKRALERMRKGLRVHPLDLSLTLGGLKDPAEAAKLYAYLHAGMWTAMPVLEKMIDIPDPHLHVGMDFSEAENHLEGEAALKAEIGTLLRAAFTVGIPALKWFLRWKKQQKVTASAPTVSERTESNGQ